MKVSELITELKKFSPDVDVFISRETEIDCVTFGFGNTVSIEFGDVGQLQRAHAIEVEDLEDKIAEYEGLENENNELEDENYELQEQIEELEGTIEDLKAQISLLKDELKWKEGCLL